MEAIMIGFILFCMMFTLGFVWFWAIKRVFKALGFKIVKGV